MEQKTNKNELLMLDKNGIPTFRGVPQALLERVPQSVLNGLDKLVYSVLWNKFQGYQSRNQNFRESHASLSHACSVTRRQLQTCMKNLEEVGLLEDLTPTLVNRPHTYHMSNWINRTDLLTEENVKEKRDSRDETSIELYLKEKVSAPIVKTDLINSNHSTAQIVHTGVIDPYSGCTDCKDRCDHLVHEKEHEDLFKNNKDLLAMNEKEVISSPPLSDSVSVTNEPRPNWTAFIEKYPSIKNSTLENQIKAYDAMGGI